MKRKIVSLSGCARRGSKEQFPDARYLRFLPRRRPLGQPPSLAFSRAARVLAFDLRRPPRWPISLPTFIFRPQCGHFMFGIYDARTKKNVDPTLSEEKHLRFHLRFCDFRALIPGGGWAGIRTPGDTKHLTSPAERSIFPL
jgi:hypothetical protein